MTNYVILEVETCFYTSQGIIESYSNEGSENRARAFTVPDQIIWAAKITFSASFSSASSLFYASSSLLYALLSYQCLLSATPLQLEPVSPPKPPVSFLQKAPHLQEVEAADTNS